MMFFFVLFFHIVFTVVQAIGLASFGTCGWINTIKAFTSGYAGVGIILLFPAIGFSFSAACMIIALMHVSSEKFMFVAEILTQLGRAGIPPNLGPLLQPIIIFKLILISLDYLSCPKLSSYLVLIAIRLRIFYLQIHRIYRGNPNVNVSKAQQEFSQGVWSNEAVRTATANAASAAVRSQMNSNPTSNPRY